MMKLDLQELLLNVFKEDKVNNGENTIFSQLSVITIKSLLPSSDLMGNSIDYIRFKEELKLLKYYKIEDEKHLLLSIDEKEYFKNKDETIYSRILPIIIGNEDYDIVEREVVKNILYTTGDVEILLEWLTITRLLSMIIENEKDIIDNLKQYIIKLAQVEFLEKYNSYYRYDCLNSDNNYQIEFEKAKVDIISILHGVGMEKYKALIDLLKIVKGEEADGKLGYIVENAIDGKAIDCKLDQNYKNMAAYIIKLRKSRIDPKDLKIKEYILPNVFSFEKGEVFFHSLLNNSKVIKKETKEDALISLIQTRAGMYLFKRDPLN